MPEPVAGTPRAVLIGGPPGSGKTTLGRALAPLLRAVVLDLDVATGPLVEVVLALIGARDLTEARAAELTRAPRYDTLFALAREVLSAGTPVVLIAPFTRERDATEFAAVRAKLVPAASARLVWLTLPQDQLASRLRTRAADRDAVKLDDLDGYLAAAAAADDARSREGGGLPSAPHLELDATRPVDELARAVLADLAARR